MVKEETLTNLQERIKSLENKQDLLINFIYEFFYNRYKLMSEDDIGRLNALINCKER